MTHRIAVRVMASAVVLLAAAVFFGWLAFIPSPQAPGYQFVLAWGAKGEGPGSFNDPIGIAVTEDEVFVADSRNSRIQVFDFNGNFRRAFGTRGKNPGQLGRPMNIAIAGGELYVADYWNDRIEVFDLDGTYKRSIGRAGGEPGEFNAPGGVAVAQNGDLFVADFYNQRVQQLNADGTFVRQWGRTGEIGWRAGAFNYPTDVALGEDGALYVADGYNDRVQVFRPDGAFSHKWGGPFAVNINGPFNGWFRTISSIDIDIGKGERVFASDFYNHRIQVFKSDGSFLTAFGSKGAGPGQFTYPLGAAVADDGAVFVVDFGNNRIQKWKSSD